MKMQKILATVLCVVMIGTVSVFAAEQESIDDLPCVGEIGPEFVHEEGNTVKPASEELLGASSLDEIAKISRKNFEADPKASLQAEIDRTKEMLAEYNAIAYSESETNETATTKAINKKEFLAYLCLSDGLSATEVVKANSDANKAANEAKNVYPEDEEGLQDSYRHFIWNHMMTKDLSKRKARTVACDYEWLKVLVPYAQSAYDDYIKQGYNSSNAASKAYQYAFFMRTDCYSVCASDVKYFSEMFHKPEVRDLWNNCYGRAYADKYTYSHATAFSVANKAWQLINLDNAVSSTNINKVWSWDWYTA